MVGVMAGLLGACGSSGKASARDKFETALEKTLLTGAKSDKERAVAECVIRTTKNLSDADYAKIVDQENATPEVLAAYRASLVACGADPTTPVP